MFWQHIMSKGDQVVNCPDENEMSEEEAVKERLNKEADANQVQFLPAGGKNGDARIEIQKGRSAAGIVGLSKEQLQEYINDPFWQRLRTALLILFWIVWLGLLIAAIAIAALAPRCAVAANDSNSTVDSLATSQTVTTIASTLIASSTS